MYSEYYAPFFDVKINGMVLPPHILKSISNFSVNYNAKSTDMGTLQFSNFEMSWLDTLILAEGDEIEVYFGYSTGKDSIFYGEVISLEPSFPSSGNPTLTLRFYDLSERLKKGVISEEYTDKTDSEIASQIAFSAGLNPIVDSTSLRHVKQVQKESDFKFLTKRAKAIGYEFYVEDNNLYFIQPRDSKSAQFTLEWKNELISFNPRLNSRKQIKEVEVRGWSLESKREIIGKAINESIQSELSPKGNLQLSKGSGGKSKFSEIDRSIKTQTEADDRAKAILKKVSDGFITGSGTCIGMPQLKAGILIELLGLGTRFNGTYYITSASHSIGSGAYTTNFSIRKRYA